MSRRGRLRAHASKRDRQLGDACQAPRCRACPRRLDLQQRRKSGTRTDRSHQSRIGEIDGRISERALAIARLFKSGGLSVEVSSNIQGHIWSKFVHNCAINPVSAVTGLRPGEIARTATAAALLDRLLDEILAVVAGDRCRCSRAPVPCEGRPAQPSQTRRCVAKDGSLECDHRGETRRTAWLDPVSADPSSPVLRRQSHQQTESPFGPTLNAFFDSIDPFRTFGSFSFPRPVRPLSRHVFPRLWLCRQYSPRNRLNALLGLLLGEAVGALAQPRSSPP